MHVVDLLTQVRQSCVSRLSHRLARGEGVRESFLHELDRFYQLLLQAVEFGDPAWLDQLLAEWVQARTQTELEDEEASLPPILNNIMLVTYEAVSETMNEKDAMSVMGAVLPMFTHALEYATREETQLHINHISSELEQAKSELERLDKTKSDFIAVAAHELKTPLTLIEGYTSMMREVLPSDVKAVPIDLYLKGIDSGSHRLREIVDDMIDVSMIDNDMLSITFQPVWLNRIFTVIEKEIDDSIKERNLILTINQFAGINEMTFGDGERLLQAFRNLVTNSIKYTPDGGKITIDGRSLPGFVEVIITDTGIGIDPDDHQRIFEKFGRLGDVALHSSSKTKFKGGGPGLGLPITKGIIEAHGGAIWVESEGYDENRCPGSVFHVLLPVRKTPPDDKMAKLFRAQ